ncbi:4'-phosphopantetheinyl transferase AcpT [Enterobacter hormaechei]|uniref:4'-phosphopantetheinyl transferase AcpT n=1 Tax=Enterobacter hormaechei TaxID=158836 RepID=UPI00064ADD6C|nr:4'-phosphopantetheinyl transferase AcpT [Enterobacter hormaechei]ELC7204580.1 4'-phosphopantetheinyl transferase AcpT [Enterobacter hormaechei]KLP65826.1 ACP synthase [Enterobacter hormaechei subsp. steigerwaltii]KTJ16420.1 ACP synthase [Enterobacter hormaechei subsp. steigerwaltii]MBE9457933.1 4'-phosphopantetheinyl transferase AcpT [Enterobacter hormaechei]MBF1967045.1 4'-phosphopantetheinyl transferase AcpT [Enterobacter hormaechei]
MYQFVLGKISTLSADPLASTLADMAPQGARHASWLAGRTLLARTLSPSPLPEIIYGEQGKPAFANGHPLWFNLSHSGDDIALLMSDEGEVGCDIEVIRPRENWQALANAVFSLTEHDELEREVPEEQLSAFWRIWTRKEAIVKQRGGSAWQIVSIDSTAQTLPVSQLRFGSLSLAVCTPTPFTLTAEAVTYSGISAA